MCDWNVNEWWARFIYFVVESRRRWREFKIHRRIVWLRRVIFGASTPQFIEGGYVAGNADSAFVGEIDVVASFGRKGGAKVYAE